MGRVQSRSGAEKEKRLQPAIDLRRKGYTLEEISESLGTGDSAWVIGKWLKRSCKIPSTRERVLELSDQPPKEISDQVGVSVRHVQRIIRGASDEPLSTHNTSEQNVDLFLSDPGSYMKADFTQSTEFGETLLKRCSHQVDIDPLEGLCIVEPSVELLDRVRHTRRTPKTTREALCLYLLSRGLEAHVYIITSQFNVALYLLDTVVKKRIDGCVPCEASYFLRSFHLYAKQRRWDEAGAALAESRNRYADLPDCGHDLYGNGRANCQLSYSVLRYHTVSPDAGAAEARKGLALLTGDESSSALFCNLTFALAKCLLPSRIPKEIEESEELLDRCCRSFKTDARSVPRTMIYWLKGQLLAVKDKLSDAIEYLTMALDDAQFLKLEDDVGCILADLGALNPAPREIRGYIEDFCECQWDEEEKDKEEILVVPPWCNKLDDKIRSLYDLSRKSSHRIDISVFSDLREAAGGDKRMPSFIIPPQSALPFSPPA